MKTKTICNPQGEVLAFIELHEGGVEVLRDADRAVFAYYDVLDDCTRDGLDRIVARGDLIERLVPLVCRRVAAA